MDALNEIFKTLSKLSSEELTTIGIFVSIIGAFLSLIVAVLGIFFAVVQLRLKQSVKISSTWKHTYQWEHEDSFISEVKLKNEKDKAEAIYAIHMRLGRRAYITLKEMHEDPIILQPFETKNIEILPASFYTTGFVDHVDLNDVLDRHGNRIVLSTSHGKHVTENGMGVWSPWHERIFNPRIIAFKAERKVIKDSSGAKKVIPRGAAYTVSLKQSGLLSVSNYIKGRERFSFGNRSIEVDTRRTATAEDFENYLKSLSFLEDMSIDKESIHVSELTLRSPRTRISWFSERKVYSYSSNIFLGVIDKVIYFLNRWIIRYNYITYPDKVSFREWLILKIYLLIATLVLLQIIWTKVL